MSFNVSQNDASCAACSAAIAASWSAKKKSTREEKLLDARAHMRRFESSLGVLSRQVESVEDENVRHKKRKAIRTAKTVLSHLPSVRTADQQKLKLESDCDERRLSEVACKTTCRNSLFWHSGQTVVGNVTRAQHCQDCRSLLKRYPSIVPSRHDRRPTSSDSRSTLLLLSFDGLVSLVDWLEVKGERLREDDAQEYDRVIASWMWCAEEELFLVSSPMGTPNKPQRPIVCV